MDASFGPLCFNLALPRSAFCHLLTSRVNNMKKIAICMSLLLCQAWALSCTTPVTISEAGWDVSTPKVAINEEGEISALWVYKNPENNENTLFTATRDGEKKWSAASLSDPVEEVGFRKAFIDDQGNHFVCWQIKKEDPEEDNLKYYQFAKKEKNQAWTPAVNILRPEDKLKHIQVAFDSQGNPLLLGHTEAKDPKETWRTEYSVVSVFYSHQKGEVKKTEFAKANSYSQHLSKNREGKVFAWWQHRGSDYSKQLTRASLQSNGSWSIPTALFHSDRSIHDTKGAMNSKGDQAMLWEESEYDKAKTIQAITCFNGQWSKPVDLAVSEDYFNKLDIAMNDEGHVVASWQRSEKGKKVIIYATEKPVGQPWFFPVALTDPKKDISHVKISIDDQGNILIAWTAFEGRKEASYAAYKPIHQEWMAPVRLSGEMCGNIKVETNHQGSFVVLWNEYLRKQISIHGATLSTATKEWSSARLSPEGQDCGSFKLVFNKEGQGVIAWLTSWDAEDFYVQVAELNVD
jgi:hypothetical protein